MKTPKPNPFHLQIILWPILQFFFWVGGSNWIRWTFQISKPYNDKQASCTYSYGYKFYLSTQITGRISSKTGMLNVPHPFHEGWQKTQNIAHLSFQCQKKFSSLRARLWILDFESVLTNYIKIFLISNWNIIEKCFLCNQSAHKAYKRNFYFFF